jgi:putative transposase
MPEKLGETLASWVEGADVVVRNKVNDYAYQLWLYEHCNYRTTIVEYTKGKRKGKQEFKHIEPPGIDQGYSAYVPEELKPLTPELFRNAVTYRFYLAWQLHEKNPKHFKQPNKNRLPCKSVLLTKELFELKGDKLIIKRRGEVLDVISLLLHRPYEKQPNMVYLRQEGHNWYVGFSYDDETTEKDSLEITEDLLEKYSKDGQVISVDNIEEDTNAYDYGVVKSCVDKNGQEYGWDKETWEMQLKDRKRLESLQKAMSYKKPSSRAYKKLKERFDRTQEKLNGRVREMNQKGSYEAATSEGFLQVIEDTKLFNLIKKNEPKHDGYEYQPNGQRAKAGLNKALASRCLGDLQQKTEHKIIREEKLPIWMPSHHTSCTCIACQSRKAENRKSQDKFKCVDCGEEGNADQHAAQYMAHKAAHVIQFLVYSLLWMQSKQVKRNLNGKSYGNNRNTSKEVDKRSKKGVKTTPIKNFSLGTNVLNYLFTGSAKTARVSLKVSGLVKRVLPQMDTVGEKDRFIADISNALSNNLLVLYEMPTQKRKL